MTCPHAGPHSPSNMTVNHTPLQFRTPRDTVNQAPAFSTAYSQSVTLCDILSQATLLLDTQEVTDSSSVGPTTPVQRIQTREIGGRLVGLPPSLPLALAAAALRSVVTDPALAALQAGQTNAIL